MITLTATQIKDIAPYATMERINLYLDSLNRTLVKYEINTYLRVCHFLAQILHESGSLRYNEEIASGDAYENRRDLGNIIKGDGRLYKGRGLMQLTGRANYELYAKATDPEIARHPQIVGTKYAVDVAGWFWTVKKLNQLADLDGSLVTVNNEKVPFSAVTAITKKVNGGLNGFAERKEFLQRAKTVLK